MSEKQIRTLILTAQEGDLGAARMLEDEIERRGLWREYIEALGITGLRTFNPPVYGWHDIATALRATPEQRARAFVEATK